MRNSKIDEKLKKTISNVTPNVLPNILARCEEKGGFFVNNEISKKENKSKNIFLGLIIKIPKNKQKISKTFCIVLFLGHAVCYNISAEGKTKYDKRTSQIAKGR